MLAGGDHGARGGDLLGELRIEVAELSVDQGRGALDGTTSQRMTETGTVSPEIGKLSTAFVVSPP